MPGRKRYEYLKLQIKPLESHFEEDVVTLGQPGLSYHPPEDPGEEFDMGFQEDGLDRFRLQTAIVVVQAENLVDHPHLFTMTRNAARNACDKAQALNTAVLETISSLTQLRTWGQWCESRDRLRTLLDEFGESVESPDFKDRHLDATFVIGR